jgi:hypothetical protein
MLVLAAVSFGADPSASPSTSSVPGLATMAWDDSNIQYLQTMKSPTGEIDPELVKFVCYEDPIADVKLLRYAGTCGVGDFTWVDLTGNHKYHLVTVSNYTDYTSHNWMRIYNRDSSGNISKQEFDGYFMRVDAIAGKDRDPSTADTTLYDLNGDGKIELVTLDALDTNYSGVPIAPHTLALWPKVYSLKNGKYVESSREFANFYDTWILPRLNRVISKKPEEVVRMISPRPTPSSPVLNTGTAQPEELLAAAEMARDKILRVLGRDSTAGEVQAREWMTSRDPELRHDAVVVFRDMGDHAADLGEAERKEKELKASIP